MLDLLVEARRGTALTQAQVAAALRKPQSYVSKIESGERRLDVVELCELLRVLGQDEMTFFQALLTARGRSSLGKKKER